MGQSLPTPEPNKRKKSNITEVRCLSSGRERKSLDTVLLEKTNGSCNIPVYPVLYPLPLMGPSFSPLQSQQELEQIEPVHIQLKPEVAEFAQHSKGLELHSKWGGLF